MTFELVIIFSSSEPICFHFIQIISFFQGPGCCSNLINPASLPISSVLLLNRVAGILKNYRKGSDFLESRLEPWLSHISCKFGLMLSSFPQPYFHHTLSGTNTVAVLYGS